METLEETGHTTWVTCDPEKVQMSKKSANLSLEHKQENSWVIQLETTTVWMEEMLQSVGFGTFGEYCCT